MAGERTEKATPKRRAEARKKGQVLRSAEVSSFTVLFATVAALALAGPGILHRLENVVVRGLSQSADTSLATHDGLGPLTAWAMKESALAVAPVVLAALLAGVGAGVAQVKLKITPEALKPSFAKLNPLSGIKRVFGPAGLVEGAKAVAKALLIGGIAFLAIWPKLPELATLVGLQPAALVATLAQTILSICFRVVGGLALIAVLDFAYQRHRHEKSIRMTKEEVKQETRQTDLPPEVRRTIRQRQMQQAMKRMLAEVPTADVVVVNPTHYAVALRYDGARPAPEVVAKGVDHVAARIRQAADEHGVPIVHNAPLARQLYRDVELGHMIPEELFTAVAEVLAFVFRTAGRTRATLARRRRRRLVAARA